MKVLIVGAGEVGIHIAQSLVREGHDLVMIEREAKKVAHLQSTMDVLAVCGDGCNPRTLREHGVADADLFFAVSDKDAVNLLAALTARELGARRAVVRVSDPDLGRNPLVTRDAETLTLYPELLVAEEIASLARVPGAGKARFFGDGRLVLLQVRPSIMAPLYGKPVRDLQAPGNWILTGIHRAGSTVIPRGDTILRPGDLIFAVGPTERMGEYLTSVGLQSRSTRKVVIAGAGQVGASLARLLVKEKIRVVVVQRGASRAFDLAAELPEVLVLRGDATDPEMLREAGVEEADYFVAATQNDEANLLSSLLARELGARAVAALYNQPEFLSVMQAVHIDVPLSPRMMIAGHILRMVHRREIISMDLVAGGKAEIVEFQVPPNSRALKRPLSHLGFPRNSIVGAVIRGSESILPTGNFRFEVGDRALVFALAETLPELERMFRGR